MTINLDILAINLDILTEFFEKLNIDNNVYEENEHILGKDNCMY